MKQGTIHLTHLIGFIVHKGHPQVAVFPRWSAHAHFVRTPEAWIQNINSGRAAGGTPGELPWMMHESNYWSVSEAPKAFESISALDQQNKERRCQRCGARTGTFEICWHCQHAASRR